MMGSLHFYFRVLVKFLGFFSVNMSEDQKRSDNLNFT